MDLTKEYLDQKLDQKFEEFAQMVAKGFAGTATRESVEKLDLPIESLERYVIRIEKELSEIRSQIGKLTETVNEFVTELHRAVRCSKLEERIEQLEHRLSFGAA